MLRNYQPNDFVALNSQELNQRIAYHEAGHATAIYLYNKQQQLPPIYFRIRLKNYAEMTALKQDGVAASLEGGCLIQNLALSFVECENYMSAQEKSAYYSALEADIVNLLAGAVAEAYYVYRADNEVLTAHLLGVHALRNYGSLYDLQKIAEYLHYLSNSSAQQNKKISQLLAHTFEFIVQPKIWQAVESVAKFILNCQKQIISCEEVFAVIDKVSVCS
jgi:hypothetical protein